MYGLREREEQVTVLRGACLSKREESVTENCAENEERVEAGEEYRLELKTS